MVLPRPPWAQPRDRCPNCLRRLPDDRAAVCDDCGYQLRVPRVSVLGLLLIAGSVGDFFLSVFGGFLFPWPDLPFLRPVLGSPTPDELAAWYLWLGLAMLLLGIALAFAGALAVRRRAREVLAGEGAA